MWRGYRRRQAHASRQANLLAASQAFMAEAAEEEKRGGEGGSVSVCDDTVG